MIELYRRLLRHYGPQGWWPVARRPGEAAVYDPRWTRGPLTPAQQWEVSLGAVLAQNTAWRNVERAFANLIAERLWSAEKIAAAPRITMERLLRPSGCFRQKAERVRGLARHVVKRWGGRMGRLLAQGTAAARAELLSLFGVGPETADSILCYAGDHPVFVVDAYTKRLAHRLRVFRYNDTAMLQTFFHHRLPARAALYREFHALIVAHAKAHCRARPACGGCPLLNYCPTGEH